MTPIPTSLPSGTTVGGPWSLPSQPTTPQLVINPGFGALIGFSAGTYPNVPQSAIYQVNGSSTGANAPCDPVTLISLNCSLVQSNNYNTFSSSIWSISPASVQYGSWISVILPTKSWFAVQPIFNCSNIVLSFTDQNNQPLQINDTNIVVNLHLRRR